MYEAVSDWFEVALTSRHLLIEFLLSYKTLVQTFSETKYSSSDSSSSAATGNDCRLHKEKRNNGRKKKTTKSENSLLTPPLSTLPCPTNP